MAAFLLTVLFSAGVRATTFCEAAIPPEIVAQAAALKNDPDLIYEFVYDNVRTLPQHGSLKGPLGTLLDRTGSEVDQAELMASLLQAAGYASAAYETGNITIDIAQLTDWLGVDDSLDSAGQALSDGGFAPTVTTDGSGTHTLFVTVPWVWVKVRIEGTDYIFDPAGKRINGYHRTAGFADLGATLGYSSSGFLANATQGARTRASIITGWAIAGLNRPGVRANLSGYSQNLIRYIKTNLPGASTSDVIGGTAITPLTVGTQQRVPAGTGFSYAASAATDYDCLPASLRTMVSFALPGAAAVMFNTSDLYGHRLSLFFDDSIRPVLRLDGAIQATGSVATAGSSVTITTVLTHNAYCQPTSCDHFADIPAGTASSTLLRVTAGRNATYAIGTGWGAVGRGMVERHRLLLMQNRAQTNDPGAEPVLGESLTMMGFTWLAELAQGISVVDQVAASETISQYDIGIIGIRPVGAGSGPYIDLPLNLVSISQRNAQPSGSVTTPLTSAAFFTIAQMSSALESGVIEQTQPTAVAVSTVKLIDLASQSGTIYDINNSDETGNTATNYTNWVRPGLAATWSHGGTSNDLGNVDTLVDLLNRRVIAPEIGNVTINGLWTGVGYYSLSADGGLISSLITGGLSGGFCACMIPTSAFVANIDTTFKPSTSSPVSFLAGVFQSLSAAAGKTISDPVNRVTGSFTYTNSDLAVGSAGFPWGLQFQRYYDSAANLRAGPLGFGWTSNFDIKAGSDSDGFEGLAANSPINGASAIAALYVMLDILNNGIDTKKPLVRVIIADQAAAWLMEQLTGNVVAITQPESVSAFVKLADGTYNPPPGSADRLTLASGVYTLSQKDGTVVTFNSTTGAAPGAIARWHSPAGPTVTYGYNGAGYLASVTTGTGGTGTNRTLSLTYNGNNQLTGVSDGTGRSVSYAYDASGNLVRFTDALGNISSYAYDPAAPGRMLQYFHPTAPDIPFITNTYDAVGRVTRQVDAAGNATNQYFAGNRTEIDDALGNSHVLYFSDHGRALIDIDALGNRTTNTYDGLDRLVATALAEGNGVAYAYDAQSNPLTITANPKPGSGLPALTSTVTYDPLWNAPAAVTDPLGLVTQFVYDRTTGSLLRTIADAGGGAGHTSVVTGSFTYNARGQVATAMDAAGAVTATSYDDYGNATAIARDAGRLNQVTAMAYDGYGDVTAATDPNGNVSRSAYDARRRTTGTTAPAAGAAPGPLVTAFAYDADDHLLATTQSVAGAVLRTTRSTYTAVGQVATSTDANGNVTRFAYDAAGRTIAVRDPLYNVTSYAYDGDGRRIAVSNLAIQPGPLSQASYTANGLPHVLTDAAGHGVTLGYDGLDRPAATTYPDASAQTLSYDADGNVVTRLTRAGDTLSYAYDTRNLLCSKAVAAVATPCTATSSANPTVWYAHDLDGRSLGARDNGAVLAAVGVQASYAMAARYDALNRPTNVAWSPVQAQAPPPASSVTFGHGYDAGNRRITQTATDTGWWAVPASASSTAYTANALNQYSAVDAVAPAYDGNGNLTFDGSFAYCYDAESRLTAVLSAGTCASPTTTVATYAYDAQGRRKSRTVGGVTTVTVADADDREVLEYDGSSGAVTAWYAYGPGANDVVGRMDVAAGTRQTLVPDIQGSIVASLDSATGVMTRWGYRPYGENPSLATDGFAYTAQRHDPETGGSAAQPSGLYYDRARIYSPTLGRFLQPDPAGTGATNLYAYVGNDPLNQTDPSGMTAEMLGNAYEAQSEGSLALGQAEISAASTAWNAVGSAMSTALTPPVDRPICFSEIECNQAFSQFGTTTYKAPYTVGDAVTYGSLFAGGWGALGDASTATAIPRGFQSAGQFATACQELCGALNASGITDATIGVRGSSMTGFSFRTGAPFGPSSDIDFYVESRQLTQGLDTSNRIPGFVYPRTIQSNYPLVGDWSKAWSDILGRKVTVGGFQPGTVPH